jgi:hypothetical protein
MSQDTGSTWREMDVESPQATWKIFFIDSTFGCAVGSGGKIWKYDPNKVSIPSMEVTISGYKISECYPNPVESASSQSVITYGIPECGNIKLALYDLLGREVQVLASGWKAPGSYTVTLSAAALPPGMYVYRLETGSGFLARKIVVR